MEFDWINLPVPLWVKILQQLDKRALLNASETCTTFSKLLGNTILTDILKLYFNFQIHKEKIDKQLLNVFKHSNRNYNKIQISCLDLKTPSEDFQSIIEILKLFSHNIREIVLSRQDTLLLLENVI